MNELKHSKSTRTQPLGLLWPEERKCDISTVNMWSENMFYLAFWSIFIYRVRSFLGRFSWVTLKHDFLYYLSKSSSLPRSLSNHLPFLCSPPPPCPSPPTSELAWTPPMAVQMTIIIAPRQSNVVFSQKEKPAKVVWSGKKRQFFIES